MHWKNNQESLESRLRLRCQKQSRISVKTIKLISRSSLRKYLGQRSRRYMMCGKKRRRRKSRNSRRRQIDWQKKRLRGKQKSISGERNTYELAKGSLRSQLSMRIHTKASSKSSKTSKPRNTHCQKTSQPPPNWRRSSLKQRVLTTRRLTRDEMNCLERGLSIILHSSM